MKCKNDVVWLCALRVALVATSLIIVECDGSLHKLKSISIDDPTNKLRSQNTVPEQLGSKNGKGISANRSKAKDSAKKHLPFQVKWSDELGIVKIEDIQSVLSKTISYEGSQNALKLSLIENEASIQPNSMTVRTGEEYVEARSQGYLPSGYYDRKFDGELLIEYGTLFYLRKANHSKYSYFRSISLNKMGLSKLSPVILSAISVAAFEDFLHYYQQERTGASLHSSLKELNFLIKENNKKDNEILMANSESIIRIKLLMWGDINEDHYEDLVVYISSLPKEGRMYASGLVVLSRKSGESSATVKEIFGEQKINRCISAPTSCPEFVKGE